jgi:hypothetical protein
MRTPSIPPFFLKKKKIQKHRLWLCVAPTLLLLLPAISFILLKVREGKQASIATYHKNGVFLAHVCRQGENA